MIAHSDTLGSLGTNGQPSHPVFEAASSALIANLVPKQHLRYRPPTKAYAPVLRIR
ncbi:hypothetical protein HBI56_080370 [Parastagonospora nodorum]|uniref:Uncharacterized protein n=1 Tax=Phaeosphaeria nodorum (strain SN15 / ATCC MYA-4574 / FGSC 10173) TaxID=321614 RepID=A0A7U2FJW1_PHANO|nr:hypothetical protein HBH56_106360 [Parastagonospora nodorum]QRD04825.1 hypothetical protein JI435_107520 [Parastagonospora nodorum SN15]KAH3929259.1 hypothetical protein HBH54_124070 [Parastagonospora nodorum]KAH3951438.1 hypothetical protein HBH53_058070 [Parastagonospora nodorum]KAH3975493.1 hypothetical protein HBH52_128820 [Parastagonospora nodorum]